MVRILGFLVGLGFVGVAAWSLLWGVAGALASHADRPEFDVSFVESTDFGLDPIGVRGIGEIGTCGVPAAIANAVFHATGKRVRDLPITPDKLL